MADTDTHTDTKTVTLKVKIKRDFTERICTPCAYNWSVYDERGWLLHSWYGATRWTSRREARRWCRMYVKGIINGPVTEEWTYTASWGKES